MKIGIHILGISMLLVALASCEKEEKPIVLPGKSDSAFLMSATMGEQYKTQVFVNIKTGQTWSVDNDSWDLQFESDEDGFLINMNGGKKVLIGTSGGKSIKSLSGRIIIMRWDNSSGMRDSSVLGNWMDPFDHISRDSVYVIDRGENNRPYEQGYQFQVKSVNSERYVLRIANLDGSDIHDVEIPKDHEKLHVNFSFSNGGQVLNFEPEKNDWHFCFTRYRWIYYEFTPPLLYNVCGIHINTSKIDVAVDSIQKFESITRLSMAGMHFKNTRDAMGYDWKVPDFSNPTGVKYNARSYVNYVLLDRRDLSQIYKIHFIGFYDVHGMKGSPQFEVEKVY